MTMVNITTDSIEIQKKITRSHFKNLHSPQLHNLEVIHDVLDVYGLVKLNHNINK